MINITKVSNVVSIKDNSNLPKSYYGIVANFNANTGSNIFVISIGGNNYEIPLGTLQVNGTTVTTMSQGITLLSAMFGS
jgi:hypothetical protein